jgi:4-hydroxy-2-oxoheptanedioate aldolase
MQIGTVLSLPGAALAELAGSALDFAWIDLEHGALGLGEMQAMAVGLAAAGCEAHVRLPSPDTDQLAAVVDAGVDGVVAPRVESALQARALVDRLRYPPAGRRGFGPRRTGRYGRNPAEGRLACTVQIESPAGVAAAPEIAAVAGVDVLVVGCSDLSLALGVPGELGSAVLQAAVSEVAAAASTAGIRFGIAGSGEPASVAALAARRADLLVYSADIRLYSAAVDAAVESLYDVHATA